jgi:hypothetical protein
MASLILDTVGKIRDRPLDAKLDTILTRAGTQAGVDTVRVTSGGQARKGTPGKRTGSTRHDDGNAADLMLELGGRALSFVRSPDLPFFETFVAVATQLGATGVGAGVGYMGPLTIHVGFGAEAVWGAGGKAANAPQWLKEAFAKGKARRGTGAMSATPTPPAPQPQNAAHAMIVTARSGLNLRSGPGLDFEVVGAVAAGATLYADMANVGEWVRVDLQNDGLADGFVFAPYLAAVSA